MLKQTKGNKILVDFGKKPQRFIAGGRRRYLIHKAYNEIDGPCGVVAVNGRIRMADGTEAYAILLIDEASSGEHCGPGVFCPDGNVRFQSDKDFVSGMGKTSAEVFPYKYKYDVDLRTNDFHIGLDGWSH